VLPAQPPNAWNLDNNRKFEKDSGIVVTVVEVRENLLPSTTSSLRFVISPITEGRLEKLFEPMYKFCSDTMLVIPTGIKPE
jgi:hypothetical protein